MPGTEQIAGKARVGWLALVFGLVVWLWPFGVGGRMPVGGDVTQFSLGLMGFLGRSLREGRLPVWNDLWGYGFPGLAESQMGVFYPPHLILYGLLPTEAAYTASLVLHTFWAGLGTYWAARTFGISPRGSALSGFAWAASGFYVIHFPHQWGYTTGSWMPWAWGLTWTILEHRRVRHAPFLLAGVLCMQILPGHFQLSFYTLVSLVLLGVWSLLERGRSVVRSGAVVVAIGAALALAAAQLWPTYRLAQLASSRRDFEYLSGFAASPLHLISYVAPRLFQRSPLWRPLVWDPFHTSPEEHLAYIGLVPLFLALGAMKQGWRSDRRVRALAALAAASLLLSLGPYLPGFSTWSRIPGFSFFRAPARWGLATELALSLLAGVGLDAWAGWSRRGRCLVRFALGAAVALFVVIGLIELALVAGDRNGEMALASAFERGFRLRPWTGDAGFREWSAAARRPQNELRVHLALARQGLTKPRPADLTFARARTSIYLQELPLTATWIGGILLLSLLPRRAKATETGLLLLTALDLWSLGADRPVDQAPLGSLVARSPILSRLAAAPLGTRTIDPSRNLPMLAGAGPVLAYRTLDLPVVTTLGSLAQLPVGPDGSGPPIAGAIRATGAEVRLLDPFETLGRDASRVPARDWSTPDAVRDPALAGWLYGSAWVAGQGPWASTFVELRPRGPSAKAWLLLSPARAESEILARWSGDPTEIVGVLRRASPLEVRRSRPEQLSLAIRAEAPATVVLSQLSHPQWRAWWIGGDGESPATIAPAFRRPGQLGWQSVNVPGPGAWTLRLEYQATDVGQGAWVSAAAWLIGIFSYGWVIRTWKRGQGGHNSGERLAGPDLP